MRTALPPMVVLVLLLAPGPAAAESRGVPLAAIELDGLRLLSVTPPALVELPVRLVYGGERPEILVDVVVARDAATARGAQVRFLDDLTGGPGSTLTTFVDENVFVAVRRVAGQREVRALAARFSAAVRAAAAVPRSAALAARSEPGRLWVEGLVATRVTAQGPATVRVDHRGGWRVARKGQGAAWLEVIGVDPWLRVVRGRVRVKDEN